MLAITTCLLLLASACAWQRDDSTGPRAVNKLGISGGNAVNITQKPYMAVLGKPFHCSAVIVHERFILTTGRCSFHTSSKEMMITVGTDNYPKRGVEYEVKKVHLHPYFNDDVIDYDLSVIELKKKLVLSDRVKVLEMGDANLKPKAGDMMEIVGFGPTEFVGRNSSKIERKLHSAKLPFVDMKECRQDFHYMTDRMICAGRGGDGIGACYGDNGGPLIYKGKLAGVINWTQPCGFQAAPTVCASVLAMRDFVDGVIKNNP